MHCTQYTLGNNDGNVQQERASTLAIVPEAGDATKSSYVPTWQRWLIYRSKSMKPAAWNILIWLLLVCGVLGFQGIAWKSYYWPDQKQYIGAGDAQLVCYSEDNPGSKYVSVRDKVACKIITDVTLTKLIPATLSDFADPPYKLKESEELNKQAFTGIDFGVYFEFSFVAPEKTGSYTVQCMAIKDVADDMHVVAQDVIHVIRLSPNDVAIDCLGLTHHSYHVYYKEVIVCSISTQIRAALDVFYKPGSVLINNEINTNINIRGKDSIFEFRYVADCQPKAIAFRVRINGKNTSDPLVVPHPSPLVTIKMLNEHQVHLRCFNPRTNGSIVSREEPVVCHIDTTEGIYARVHDFANPPISVTPTVFSISELKARTNDSESCRQTFEVSFESPPVDVTLEIRGHLRSGGTLFSDGAQILEMGHVSPRPHELNVSCQGDLSGAEGVALHQELIVCQIVSEYEFLPSDFADFVFRVKDENDREYEDAKINITSFEGRYHRQGIREETHKEYDLRFEILDDEIKQLRLYLVLRQNLEVVNEEAMVINTISCPRDGAVNCKHWEFNLVNQGDNMLRLLPATEHYYFSDWKYVTFAGMANVKDITELILEHNKLPSLPVKNSLFTLFPAVRRLSLAHNEMTSLGEAAFKGLYSLTELDLSHNEIEDIDYKAFDSVLQITSLNLANNALDKVASIFHTIHMLTSLVILNVMNNNLRYIEEEVLQMDKLSEISIGGEFQCIPSFVSNDYIHKIREAPAGEKCICPSALLSNGQCGGWQYVQRQCVSIENNTADQCFPALLHDGELSTLTALDSLDLDGFEHIGYINVSGNNLTVLPNTFLIHFPKLRILDISFNKIEALHSNTFEGLSPNILILDNNRLEALSPLIFSVSLRRLSIENNSIRSIPSYTLHNLPDLGYINLAHNELEELPRDFLQTSTELSDLIVSHNRLTDIDSKIFDGKKVANVDFGGNRISLLISHQFDIIENIGELDLSYNEITGLPNHLFNTDIELELNRLDLTGNALYNIAPHFMPKAQLLSFLSLGENFLYKLDPRSLRKYRELIEVDLHSNSFEKIKADMFPRSESMITLNLADNPLTEIDDKTFTKFPKLSFLDLSHTDLTYLDVDDLYGVPELETLSLEYSKLEKLQIDQFQHVTNLNILRLSHCQLQSISEINFGAQLSKLTELYLTHNPFRWIGDKSFSQFPNIERVDLSHCNLTELHISDHAFADSNIVNLQLSYNNLTDINQKWINSLTTLEDLNVTHNPIKGLKSDTFEHSALIKAIDLRWTNIPCQPEWLVGLGIVTLLDEKAKTNCISCPDAGWWSNGTELCVQCSKSEVCPNDEWDETGTFRLKASIAGKPPDANTISFVDTDYHPNLVGGTLKWGAIPDESVANTEEWAFYLSLDGKTSDNAAIVVVDVNDANEYLIPPATDVGFQRYLLMYGRNGGGDGKEFSSFRFADACTLCVTNVTFRNESPRKFHMKGELVFNGPLHQEGIYDYKIYVGHNPNTNENLKQAPIKKVRVSNVREYRVFIDEINTNGMPYLWIRSFFEDGYENDTPTNDVQSIKITYSNEEKANVNSADRQVQFDLD